MAQTIVILCLAAFGVLDCSGDSNQAFLKSHDSINAAFTQSEAFDAELADYLMSLGAKNVPGATLPEKQPARHNCKRHVLDNSFSGSFKIRVLLRYMNSPSASQLLPDRIYDAKQAFLQVLGADYIV